MELGIILAGGLATRLRPATAVVSKQLLPVYDKPMIYYPLTSLILAGFRRIAIISTPIALPHYKELFKDGRNLGLEFDYIEQSSPNGLASAFILTEKLIMNKSSALILGDNLFHGSSFGTHLQEKKTLKGAEIFAYAVDNPSDFGVVTFDAEGNAISLTEKPKELLGKWAVPGLYFYDDTVVERAKSLQPSQRGELEITDLNRTYLKDGLLKVNRVPRGTAWLDLGTVDGLLEASEYVRTLQKRQGVPIGSPEEATWRVGNITDDEFEQLIDLQSNPHYRALLEKAIDFR